MRARKRLLMGKLVDPSEFPKDLEDFAAKDKRDIHRYFPFTWKSHIHDEYSSSADGYTPRLHLERDRRLSWNPLLHGE